MDDELDNGGGSIGTGASQLSSSSDGAGPAVEPSAAEAAAATKKKEETVQLQVRGRERAGGRKEGTNGNCCAYTPCTNTSTTLI